ncbi:indole-3-glycerol phosphate synthase TrpC [Henriciella sp. AS95]|uniref:indole-3-glycerol phosphate synthase TrpC n=1 Tax=Henriciella sp. AS95 TaxID=3135782 RepID=UPI00317A1C76
MTTALDRIIDYKRGEVATLKASRSVNDFMMAAQDADAPRGFEKALANTVSEGANALICELKRKSPSAGVIESGADPVKVAQDYETGGAACLSVLTDGPSFGGSLDDLTAVHQAVALPILRKEFIIDVIQVVEARAYSADAILVILSAVDDALAHDLLGAASDLGMDAIVEVHDEAELHRANALPCTLVGVNNRDLKRMVTDLSTTETLAHILAPEKTLISESGISTPEHIIRLQDTGAQRFLIGESLMKSDDRVTTCKNLRNASTS